MSPPTRLGDLLLSAGVVTDLQLQTALAEQQRWGGRLGTILVRMGALSEDLLVKALSKQLGIPRADLSSISVPESIRARLDNETCERLGIIPIRYIQERRALVTAVSDPFNVVILDDLSRRVGLRIEPVLAGETQIHQAIQRLFGDTLKASTGSLRMTDNLGNSVADGAPVTTPTEPSAPVRAPMGVTMSGISKRTSKELNCY